MKPLQKYNKINFIPRPHIFYLVESCGVTLESSNFYSEAQKSFNSMREGILFRVNMERHTMLPIQRKRIKYSQKNNRTLPEIITYEDKVWTS